MPGQLHIQLGLRNYVVFEIEQHCSQGGTNPMGIVNHGSISFGPLPGRGGV
jgi:hypothetical protein